MVILPISMVFKIVIVQGVVMAKNIWKSMVDFVDRHPSIFTAVTVILIFFTVAVGSVNRGYVKILRHDNETATHRPSFRYDKPASVELAPGFGVLFEPAGMRGAVLVELGYIRPMHADLLASIPLFEEVDFHHVALGLGVSTPVREHLFIGLSYNVELFGDNQRDFWGIYGKVRW